MLAQRSEGVEPTTSALYQRSVASDEADSDRLNKRTAPPLRAAVEVLTGAGQAIEGAAATVGRTLSRQSSLRGASNPAATEGLLQPPRVFGRTQSFRTGNPAATEGLLPPSNINRSPSVVNAGSPRVVNAGSPPAANAGQPVVRPPRVSNPAA